MGNHGIGGYRSRPRATEDVDVLVVLRDHAKAVEAIRGAYPELEVLEPTGMTRFRDTVTGNVVIDVMKPVMPIYEAAFRNTVLVGRSHRIPDLEMALASKYAAMISPLRDDDKRLVDGADFVNIVKRHGADIDLAKLKRLADKVYRGRSKEIERFVDTVRAGRRLRF